jgi:hypothetical protein
MVVVALVSALLRFWRAESLSRPDEIASKGLAATRRERVIFYGVFLPVVVGLVSFFLYRFIQARSPDSAQTIFLFLAIGLVVVFTVLAAVVFKMKGFVELIVLHLVYAAGFGWLMPLLLAR